MWKEVPNRPVPRTADSGFTLIELLVVIIIIGILAAIAIPVFLNQRQKGYDASAKSDIKSLAEHQEMYLVDENVYASIAQLQADGLDVRVSPGVTVEVVRYDGSSSFCLSAAHANGATTWFWDSSAGGLQSSGAAGCPVATTGVAGGSLSG